MTALDDLLDVAHETLDHHPSILAATVVHHGDEITLALAGELDVTAVKSVHEAIAPLLGEDPARLSIDLSELEFCDCGGLRVLRWAAHQAAERGIAFQLLTPNALVRRLFALTRAEELSSACRTDSRHDRPV